MKVAVVGAGVIGLSIALELRRLGLEVVVIDKSSPGSEASSAAAGMLAPQKEAHSPGPFLELALTSRAMWPSFAAQVAELSGHRSTYLPSGILAAAFNATELVALESRAQWQQAMALRVELLTPTRARALEPALSDRALRAAWFPDEHQIDPRSFLPALAEACRRAEVRMLREDVAALVEERGRVNGVRLGQGLEHADRVVLAAGAWSSRIWSQSTPLVEPIRGQVVELRAEGLTRIIAGPRCYLVPRGNGRVLAGTTEERAGYDKSVTVDGLRTILTAVAELCPPLASAPVIASWAGLRPWVAGELPVVSEGPRENLVVATGHFRNGVLLAPVTARLVSQLILGQAPALDLKPFRYDRFPS
jgi:glycine oxidase